MRFDIYDLVRDRFLSDEELEGQYYYTGRFDRSYPEPNEYIEPFKINLLNGKIQTDHNNACSDPDCCTPCKMFADNDNFILLVGGMPITQEIKTVYMTTSAPPNDLLDDLLDDTLDKRD